MKLNPVAFPLALLPLALSAQTQLGVHEHGHGMLNLALDQQQLVLELSAPAADIVGFEHDAATDAEKAQLATAQDKLRQADSLFSLAPAAGCRLEKVELVADEHEDQDHHDDHDHDHKHKDKHAHGDHQDDDDHKDQDPHHDHDHAEAHGQDHSDVQVHYFYHCGQPDALNRIDVALFEQFPSFNRLEVQGILPSGQVAATLTPAQPQLSW